MVPNRKKNRLLQPVAIGTNPERTRAHNRRVVLEVIRLHGHLGRSAIAQHARLTPQAVANIVDDLLEKRMLVQLGRLRTGRGQPPIQFALNPDGPMTAGVEIAADRLVAVLMDLSGRVRAQMVEPLISPEPQAVVAQLCQALCALCAQVGIAPPPCFHVEPRTEPVPSRGPMSAGIGQSHGGQQAEDGGVDAKVRAGNAASDAQRLVGADGQAQGASRAQPDQPPANHDRPDLANRIDHDLPRHSVQPIAAAALSDQISDPSDLAEQSQLLGVGVVMPGPFENEAMNSVGPGTLPQWSSLRADELFSAALGLPVRLCNDATAAAVGERLYGVGQQASNFCYLYFGVGLGLGIIQDGRPANGAFGNAGEIGHIRLMPRRGPGIEGAGGALEQIASVHALRAALARSGVAISSVEDIERLADVDDPQLAAWIDEAANYLAPAVAMIENIFDPELVVFGGALPDRVMARLIAALEPLPVSVSQRPGRRQPRVIAGQTGQMIAALGAASLPLLDTVSPHLSIAELVG